jgi:hypothetical protein
MSDEVLGACRESRVARRQILFRKDLPKNRSQLSF